MVSPTTEPSRKARADPGCAGGPGQGWRELAAVAVGLNAEPDEVGGADEREGPTAI